MVFIVPEISGHAKIFWKNRLNIPAGPDRGPVANVTGFFSKTTPVAAEAPGDHRLCRKFLGRVYFGAGAPWHLFFAPGQLSGKRFMNVHNFGAMVAHLSRRSLRW